MPHSPILLLARLAYELHQFFLPVLCVAYRMGGIDKAVESLEQVRMGLLIVFVLCPVAWLYMVYDYRARTLYLHSSTSSLTLKCPSLLSGAKGHVGCRAVAYELPPVGPFVEGVVGADRESSF